MPSPSAIVLLIDALGVSSTRPVMASLCSFRMCKNISVSRSWANLDRSAAHLNHVHTGELLTDKDAAKYSSYQLIKSHSLLWQGRWGSSRPSAAVYTGGSPCNLADSLAKSPMSLPVPTAHQLDAGGSLLSSWDLHWVQGCKGYKW